MKHKRSLLSSSARPRPSAAVLRLLRRVARTADTLARRVQGPASGPATHGPASDVAIWSLAEDRVLSATAARPSL